MLNCNSSPNALCPHGFILKDVLAKKRVKPHGYFCVLSPSSNVQAQCVAKWSNTSSILFYVLGFNEVRRHGKQYFWFEKSWFSQYHCFYTYSDGVCGAANNEGNKANVNKTRGWIVFSFLEGENVIQFQFQLVCVFHKRSKMYPMTFGTKKTCPVLSFHVTYWSPLCLAFLFWFQMEQIGGDWVETLK